MRAETSTMPQSPYEIIIKGDTAYINFYENAHEIPSEEQPRWVCDTYQIKTRNRANLEASIQSNFDAWLNMAKANEAPAEPTEAERMQQKLDMQDMVIEEILFSILPEILGGNL